MNCIFCKIGNKEINSNLVYEDDILFSIMDINPVCDGHILIIPKKHYETVFDTPKDVLDHMYNVAKNIGEKVMKATNEQGYTLLFNFGDKQEVKHVHMHLLPNLHKKATSNIEEIYRKITD